MIKITIERHQILLKQQKEILRPVNQDQLLNLLLVVLCI